MIGTNTLVIGIASQVVGIGAGNVSYPTSALVKNPGPGTVFLGGSSVNTSAGFPLATGEAIEVDTVNEALYAIATVTTTVNVLRRGD